MKKIFVAVIASLLSVTAGAQSLDLKEALKDLKNGNGSTAETVKGAIGNLLSTDKLDLKALEGTWNYSSPAVTFKSDNLLKKAGGAAASAAVIKKLEPVYKLTGVDKLVLTIDKEGNFSMKVRSVTLKGTVETVTDKESQANFIFNFKAASRNIGKMNAYVEKNVSGNLKITFDVTKLVELLQQVGKFTGNKTVNGLTKILSGYDGLCAGFELKK